MAVIPICITAEPNLSAAINVWLAAHTHMLLWGGVLRQTGGRQGGRSIALVVLVGQVGVAGDLSHGDSAAGTVWLLLLTVRPKTNTKSVF